MTVRETGSSETRCIVPKDSRPEQQLTPASLGGYLSRMVSTAFAIVSGLMILSATVNAARAQQIVTLESVNHRNFFVRHRNFLGELTGLDRNSFVDLGDATFFIRPALNGMQGAISFESASVRGFFLRHQNFRLKLVQGIKPGFDLPKDSQIAKDASFFQGPGLAGGPTASYRSVEFGDHFIRSQREPDKDGSFPLWLNSAGGPHFAEDASFYIHPGFRPSGCAQWYISGSWLATHTPRGTTRFALTLVGSTTLAGRAVFDTPTIPVVPFSHVTVFGDHFDGPVTGTINGKNFSLVATSSGGQTKYAGQVDDEGFFQGVSFAVFNPQSADHWVSNTPARCSQAAAAPPE